MYSHSVTRSWFHQTYPKYTKYFRIFGKDSGDYEVIISFPCGKYIGIYIENVVSGRDRSHDELVGIWALQRKGYMHAVCASHSSVRREIQDYMRAVARL